MYTKINKLPLLLVLFVCAFQSLCAQISAQDRHRPDFHFTPDQWWMNDPNGMVYYEGEYHLFYQYYPEATVWGPMHWGHAVSTDLVHWEHLPIALYPDSLGLIFSGSAVVDWNNSSGFGKNGQAPLVAIFTQHDMAGEKAGRHDFQYQSIAYSNDKGRTWTKYAGNPVIPNTEKIHDFRDPKVIWHEASRHWIMVFAAQDHVKFWRSPDLIHWTFLSDFGQDWGCHGGVWECPDLFPIKIEGTDEWKWVLLQSINPGGPNGGSATQYFVGDFDGKQFELDPAFEKLVTKNQGVWLDWGRDNYAGVTWSDIPASDGRRIFMGWMSNWDYATKVPTEKWRSAMTLPRALSLRKTQDGLRLAAVPVQELKQLETDSFMLKNRSIVQGKPFTPKIAFTPARLAADLWLDLGENKTTTFWVVLSNDKNEEYRIGYDAASNTYISDRTRSGNLGFSDKFAIKPHQAQGGERKQKLHLQLYFDVASCELFADEGLVNLTDVFFPSADFTTIRLENTKGKVKLTAAKFYQLSGKAGK